MPRGGRVNWASPGRLRSRTTTKSRGSLNHGKGMWTSAYLSLRLTNRVITIPSHTANQPNTTTPKSIASIFLANLDLASLKHRLLTEIEGSNSASGFNGSFTYCSHSLLNSASLPCKASSCFSLYKMYPAYPATPKIQITDITMPLRCHVLSFSDTANLQKPTRSGIYHESRARSMPSSVSTKWTIQ